MNTGDMDKLHDELIAYLEDELGPGERAQIEGEIHASEALRAELAWLQTAYADLDAAGRRAADNVPSIDIVDSVMQSVRRVTEPAPKVVSLDDARRRKNSVWLGLASAAAVAVVAGYVALHNPDGSTRTPGGIAPSNGVAPGNPATTPVPTVGKSDDPTQQKLEKQRKELQKFAGIKPDGMQSTAGPKLVLPGSVADVVAARREGSGGGASMEKLLQWASLNKSKALEIALSPDATPQAMLGAAESLSGDEARRILLTAVGKLQEDPNSRLQLAKAYAEDPTTDTAAKSQNETQAVAQLADVKNVDPGNALPYYYEAKLQFDTGNTEAALQALKSAANLNSASAYSLESALAKAEALIAGGMDPDAAKLVTALTGGVDENKFLCQVARDLLEYGQGFLSANDTQTAQEIFQAVEQLGRQVQEGATFSQEQLAGMDIQAQALEALGPLYTTIESADGVAQVTAATEALTNQIQEFSSFFTALEQLFQSPMTTDFWNMVSGLILDSGDLNLFNNADVTSALTPTTTR